jgi:hypothetical protein
VFIQDFKPQSAYVGFTLPAGNPSGNNTLNILCIVRNAIGATASSAPVTVKVTWDAALLADPAAQSVLIETQSADARALVRVQTASDSKRNGGVSTCICRHTLRVCLQDRPLYSLLISCPAVLPSRKERDVPTRPSQLSPVLLRY